MDGRGLPAPKSDDSLVPLSIGTLWHTTATTPALQPPLSLFLLTASWTDERREVTEGGSEGSPSRQQAPTPSVLCCRSVPYFNKVLPRRFERGLDSFTCIPASTTKSSGLNDPTEAVQPFLGFVESGFPFTHNGGAAPTNQSRQAATVHNALFAQQIHFEVDLFARPIVGMCTRYHKGPISQQHPCLKLRMRLNIRNAGTI